MVINILRLTGMASAVVALGACGGDTTTEADQRGAIIERTVDTCVRGFDQRRSQTPGITPAGLEARRFCNCAVARLAEGKSADDLAAMESDHSLTPTEGQVVSTCLNQEALRAGVIEEELPPPRAPRRRTASANASAEAPPSSRTAATRTADRTPARTPTPASARARPSEPIATPVSPPRAVAPAVPPGFSPPRQSTPVPNPPRSSGPASLLPRSMSPPPAPAPRPSTTRPPPEG